MSLSEGNIEQLMPASLDAERSILGALLLSEKYDEAAALGLTPGDFSLDSHRRIYSRMIELAESSRPIDMITLVEELNRHKELEAIGDYGYVSSLVDGVPDRPSIRHYVRIVREKSDQRKLIHACNSSIGSIVEGQSSQGAIEALGEKILQIQTGSDDSPAQRVAKFSDEIFNEWERLASGCEEVIGLSSGMDSLDIATTGIRKGELWLVAGPQATEKHHLPCKWPPQVAAERFRLDFLKSK